MDIDDLLNWVFESRCLNTLLTNPQIEVENLIKESLPYQYQIDKIMYLSYKKKTKEIQIDFNQALEIKEKLVYQKIMASYFKK